MILCDVCNEKQDCDEFHLCEKCYGNHTITKYLKEYMDKRKELMERLIAEQAMSDIAFIGNKNETK